MRRQLLTAVAVFVVMTVLCGLVYPLVLTSIGQLAFSHQADGSMVTADHRDVGSSLLGQNFLNKKGDPLPRYFQPRPSAAGPNGYQPPASGASNLGPSNSLLIGNDPAHNAYATPADPFCVPVPAVDAKGSPETTRSGAPIYQKTANGTYVCNPDTVPARAIAYRSEFGLPAGAPVPVDAVTSSGSGLDPDISIANADIQAATVARARGIPLARVMALIRSNTTRRSLGVLGDPGVDVLTLNIALHNLSHP